MGAVRYDAMTALPCSDEALRLLRAGEMLVLEGVPWEADLEVIRTGLVNKRRGPADPFGGREMEPAVRREVDRLAAHADCLMGWLYRLPATARDVMFRPMISGPEPMHFDTFSDEAGCWISAFINVSTGPRKYRLGPTLMSLSREVVREVLAECQRPSEFSYRVRERTNRGRPPLGPDAWRVELEFGPGAIWFFNSKTVSHELVYGEGAVSIGWCVPGAAPTQAQVLESLEALEMGFGDGL